MNNLFSIFDETLKIENMNSFKYILACSAFLCFGIQVTSAQEKLNKEAVKKEADIILKDPKKINLKLENYTSKDKVFISEKLPYIDENGNPVFPENESNDTIIKFTNEKNKMIKTEKNDSLKNNKKVN